MNSSKLGSIAFIAIAVFGIGYCTYSNHESDNLKKEELKKESDYDDSISTINKQRVTDLITKHNADSIIYKYSQQDRDYKKDRIFSYKFQEYWELHNNPILFTGEIIDIRKNTSNNQDSMYYAKILFMDDLYNPSDRIYMNDDDLCFTADLMLSHQQLDKIISSKNNIIKGCFLFKPIKVYMSQPLLESIEDRDDDNLGFNYHYLFKGFNIVFQGQLIDYYILQ